MKMQSFGGDLLQREPFLHARQPPRHLQGSEPLLRKSVHLQQMLGGTCHEELVLRERPHDPRRRCPGSDPHHLDHHHNTQTILQNGKERRQIGWVDLCRHPRLRGQGDVLLGEDAALQGAPLQIEEEDGAAAKGRPGRSVRGDWERHLPPSDCAGGGGGGSNSIESDSSRKNGRATGSRSSGASRGGTSNSSNNCNRYRSNNAS